MKRVDLTKLKTVSIKERKSKVSVSDFAKTKFDGSFSGFIDTFPEILAGKTFRAVVDALASAHHKKKPVVFCMGAHVIKCGITPLLIEAMNRRVLTAFALNGAGVVHDVEIALFGKTSEHVEEGLEDGTFGMAKETADFINGALKEAKKKKLGFGEVVGAKLLKEKAPHLKYSLFANAAKRSVPVTVHVGVGTDIHHMHPSCDGEALGGASYSDFLQFCHTVSALGGGGVLFNAGSAVILPEVWLKALTIAKNLGADLNGFVGVNFDFIQHYRSETQVVSRIKKVGGTGYSIIGHHEIMLPLLFHAVFEKVREQGAGNREQTKR